MPASVKYLLPYFPWCVDFFCQIWSSFGYASWERKQYAKLTSCLVLYKYAMHLYFLFVYRFIHVFVCVLYVYVIFTLFMLTIYYSLWRHNIYSARFQWCPIINRHTYICQNTSERPFSILYTITQWRYLKLQN